MESAYVKNLIIRVIQNSESSIWEDAVEKWEITDCEEDDSASKICICGKENIKYLFTIRNTINDHIKTKFIKVKRVNIIVDFISAVKNYIE